MAKGFEKHQEELAARQVFAKELVRRSGSACELCGTSGTALEIFTIPPEPKEPDLDSLLFICSVCREDLAKPHRLDPNRWQVLREAIWSEKPGVQVIALRILTYLKSRTDWAGEVLEQAQVEPVVEEWARRDVL